jgi:putative PEP-CTERM system histidine kinase
MEDAFPFFAALVAAVGFHTAGLLFAFRGKRSPTSTLFSLALLLTGVWATSVAVVSFGYGDAGWARLPLAALRDAGWFAVILGVLRQDTEKQLLWRQLAAAAAVVVSADLGFALSGATLDTGLGLRLTPAMMQIATSIMGLILIENLLLNVSTQRRWSVRLMGIGLGTLFGYNIILYIPQFLGGDLLQSFVAAQPLVYLLALPLFVVTGVRNNSLRLQAYSSRNVLFHSATLIFAGVLLQGTALAALYVRSFGGAQATALSIVLGCAGVLIITIMLSSRTIRSRVRTLIVENFYSYKYDYRLEWTKFIYTLSQHQEQGAPTRALRTLADLLDSQGAILWVRRSGWRQYIPIASWCFGQTWGPVDADDPILQDIRKETIGFLELSGSDSPPIWRERFPGAWLAVPLHYRGELFGFALLRQSRAFRRLDWEDRNLVGLIAQQLALYLVHEQIEEELADSQQLIEFNNRVAFALHDVKNTIGQLKLVLHNAERFGDDPRFRADMLATIEQAVENLHTLMDKLRSREEAPPSKPSRIDISQAVARCAERKSTMGVVFRNSGEAFFADIARVEDFETALEHVVTNAVEASSQGSNVHIRIEQQDGRIRVFVEDRGVGMSPEFVSQELFRPLRTTKKRGMGIGAYQARTMMRAIGGDMEVQSASGRGTTVSLVLPAYMGPELRATA